MTDSRPVERAHAPGAPDPRKPSNHTGERISEGPQDREEYALREKLEMQVTMPLSLVLFRPSQAGLSKTAALWQMVRFGIVGAINTVVDITTLNVLLWRFPLHSTSLLLIYNSLAYALGAVCSFILNKYWTFRSGRVVSRGEVTRFVLVAAASFLCNDGLIWIAGTILHPFLASPFLWANLSKAGAAVGTAFVSYLVMRLWVFAHAPGREGGSGMKARQ